jgi:hypothetical protein
MAAGSGGFEHVFESYDHPAGLSLANKACAIFRDEFTGLRPNRKKTIYPTGSPNADGTRKIQCTTYRLKISLCSVEQAIARGRKEARRFVLITNEPGEDAGVISSQDLLRVYQDDTP